VNLALLEVLRARRGDWCRTQDLADHLFLGVPRLLADLRDLREAGYLIESDADRRHRFLGVADRLIPHEIARGLGTRSLGRNVICLDSVSSTNDELWRLAERGAPEGTVVLAEHQTRGRGRFGRRWVCPPGRGILMSVLLRPAAGAARTDRAKASVPAPVLTVMGAVAAVDALNEHLGLPVLIKWPNDIVARGRKVGGLLLESRRTPGGAEAVVLGLGLNANLQPEDLPEAVRSTATSLSLLAGRPVERIGVVRALLRALERWYGQARLKHYGRIGRQWRQYSSTLGSRITIEEDGCRYRGRVLDLSLEEGIVLGLDRGGTRTFDGARVTVVA